METNFVTQMVVVNQDKRSVNSGSGVCWPFFGLVIGYGAILRSWTIILVGVLWLNTNWFWFPKLGDTPVWAKKFIIILRHLPAHRVR